MAGAAGLVYDMAKLHESLHDDDRPWEWEPKYWKPKTTPKEKYELCCLRFDTNWHDAVADFKNENLPDRKLPKLIEDFCKTAHYEEHKDKEERNKKLKKKYRVVADYQLNKLETNIGKADLLEDYKEIYEETKGNPYYVVDED